jgi:hypothetical protein
MATVSDDERIRDMIQAVLFTSPGERVNRPSFGSGIRQLVFSPNTAAIAAAVEANVQASLQLWLGDLVLIESVITESDESTLYIGIVYRRLADGERSAATFSLDAGQPA